MDPYMLCPCGSGKKLKFCCSDLIGEIEKIHRMIAGDQPRAALQHVQQTLVQQPGRASLLDLKAMLEMSLDDFAAARQTIADFLAADPNSPSAHAQHALLLAWEEKSSEAIEALQNSLDLVEVNLPQRVVSAIMAVGYLLLKLGDVVAARAHLWLSASISDDPEDPALELLLRMSRVEGLPLLLRDQLALRSLAKGHPVEVEMAAIQQLAAAGKWRSAAAQLDELLPDHLDEPIFFYNRALLSGYLGDRKNFIAGMRLFARQEIPLDDAVEAEALAQLLDAETQEPPTEVVSVTYEVADDDALVERLADHDQTVNFPVPEDQFSTHDGPRPKAFYMLLDRPEPSNLENPTRDEVPRILGFVSHYSRQTDRAERVELTVNRDEQFDTALAAVTEVAGDALASNPTEEVVSHSPSHDSTLNWRWYFPPQTPKEHRRALLAKEREAAFLERWPEKPRRALGGKSPREAAADDQLRLPLLAQVLLLEQGSRNVGFSEVFAKLRNELGLPAATPIAGDSIDASETPLVRINRIQLADLSDNDLSSLYQRAMLVNATEELRRLITEALRRPGFGGKIPLELLYEQLFNLEDDSSKALGVLDEARSWAEAEGKSTGPWDYLELELHIDESNPVEANRMLEHLRDEHSGEPEIAERVYQLLYSIGAIPEQAPHNGPRRAPAVPPVPMQAGVAAESSIWTPGGESGGEGQSKLWTPD